MGLRATHSIFAGSRSLPAARTVLKSVKSPFSWLTARRTAPSAIAARQSACPASEVIGVTIEPQPARPFEQLVRIAVVDRRRDQRFGGDVRPAIGTTSREGSLGRNILTDPRIERQHHRLCAAESFDGRFALRELWTSANPSSPRGSADGAPRMNSSTMNRRVWPTSNVGAAASRRRP